MYKYRFLINELDKEQHSILVEMFKIDIAASLSILRSETDSERVKALSGRFAFTIKCLELLLNA